MKKQNNQSSTQTRSIAINPSNNQQMISYSSQPMVHQRDYNESEEDEEMEEENGDNEENEENGDGDEGEEEEGEEGEEKEGANKITAGKLLANEEHVKEKVTQLQDKVVPKRDRRTKPFIQQVFDNAIDTARDLLSINDFLFKDKFPLDGPFSTVKQNLKEYIQEKGLSNWLSTLDIDQLNQVADELCIGYSAGSCRERAEYIHWELICYGVHRLLEDLPPSQLSKIYKIYKCEVESSKNKLISKILWDTDDIVTIVIHNVKCHNCMKTIKGWRAICTEMAAYNFCVQCAERLKHKGYTPSYCYSVLHQDAFPSINGLHVLEDSFLDQRNTLSDSDSDSENENDNENKNTRKRRKSTGTKKGAKKAKKNHTSEDVPKISNSSIELKATVAHVINQINNFVLSIKENRQNGRESTTLEERWNNTWHEQLLDLEKRAELPDVCFAVASPSGTGKSSLLNAVLGHRILPSGCTSEACSAGAVSVCYWPKNFFEVEVEFLTTSEWLKEQDGLLQEASDSNEISISSHRTLMCIYGSALPKVLDKTHPLLQAIPASAEFYLDTSMKYQLETADATREIITHFTTDAGKSISFWPIVKQVIVRGPFIELSSGARLIDLPGVNDINKSRQTIYKKFLQDCNYIWVLSDITRAGTDSNSKMLINEAFLTRLKAYNMWKSLTYIATKADIINEQEVKEKLSLPEDASILTCVLERNKNAKHVIQNQLFSEIEDRMSDISQEDEESDSIGDDWKDIKIFTVSSKSYMQLIGIGQNNNPLIFSDINDTQIPALQQLLHDCTEARAAKLYKITESLDKTLASILHELSISVDKATSSKIQEYFKQMFHKFIHELVLKPDFVKKVQSDLKDVEKQLNKIVDLYAKQDTIEAITAPWQPTHFKTLRATCARNGLHKNLNFNFDIGKKLINGVTPAWNLYYKNIHKQIKNIETNYIEALNKFHEKLATSLKELGVSLSKNSYRKELLEEKLEQKLTQARDLIKLEERKCFDLVESVIEERMHPTYSVSAAIRGKGCQKAMLAELKKGLIQKHEMFKATTKQIIDEMKVSTNRIGDIVQTASADLKHSLHEQYQIYWAEIQEKGPFEILITKIRKAQRERETKLEANLNHEADQRKKAAAMRIKKQQEIVENRRQQEEQRESQQFYQASQQTVPDFIDVNSAPEEIAPPIRTATRIKEKKQKIEIVPDSGRPSKEKNSSASKTKANVLPVPANLQLISPPKQSDVFTWSPNEVADWLQSLPDFCQYAGKFLEQKIKGVHLLRLTDTQLEQLGIKLMGDRHDFMALIESHLTTFHNL